MLSPFFEDEFLPFRLTLLRDDAAPRNSRSLAASAASTSRALRPVMEIDLVEGEQDYSVHADLPGVDKSDIDINVENGVLTITAERRNRHEEKSKTSHLIERSYGKVQRSIRVPSNADATKASAKFENGVLELTLPKVEQRGSKIAVN
jgi:HSP20 family protein